MEILYNALAYLRQGGPVMVPIVLLSTLIWGLIIERVLFFRRMERAEAGWPRIRDLNGFTLPSAAGTALCSPVIRALDRHRSGKSVPDGCILDQYALRRRNSLWRSLSLIAALAAAAPMLGLFGTVTGMINTFEAIMFFGTGNA